MQLDESMLAWRNPFVCHDALQLPKGSLYKGLSAPLSVRVMDAARAGNCKSGPGGTVSAHPPMLSCRSRLLMKDWWECCAAIVEGGFEQETAGLCFAATHEGEFEP